MVDNKQKVKDFYLSREFKKSGVKMSDKNVRENLYVIDCCDVWDLNQILSDQDFSNLVTVVCEESTTLIKNGRLLKDVAVEADRQLHKGWESGRNKKFIEKLLSDLEKDSTLMASDTVILREKVCGEPINGSHYLQDGNHRMIAAGIYWVRHGSVPSLTFHIGKSINKPKFFSER